MAATAIKIAAAEVGCALEWTSPTDRRYPTEPGHLLYERADTADAGDTGEDRPPF